MLFFNDPELIDELLTKTRGTKNFTGTASVKLIYNLWSNS
jgi:hypothetical protein